MDGHPTGQGGGLLATLLCPLAATSGPSVRPFKLGKLEEMSKNCLEFFSFFQKNLELLQIFYK